MISILGCASSGPAPGQPQKFSCVSRFYVCQEMQFLIEVLNVLSIGARGYCSKIHELDAQNLKMPIDWIFWRSFVSDGQKRAGLIGQRITILRCYLFVF